MWLGGLRNRGTAKGHDSQMTFLGKGARFKGSINFDGTIRIDGRLEGEIHTKGTLIVGEHAEIEGDITADTVISGGKITGNIVAAQKVQLLAPGTLVGTVKAPLFSIEEGVGFTGSCEAEGRGEIRTLDSAREAALQSAATRSAAPVRDHAGSRMKT
jgi:cytoskeletal protein CcmA (bactofilin family)